MKYKLLRGTHRESVLDEDGSKGVKRSEVYKAGEVFDSPHDLIARFGGDKFEKVAAKKKSKPKKKKS